MKTKLYILFNLYILLNISSYILLNIYIIENVSKIKTFKRSLLKMMKNSFINLILHRFRFKLRMKKNNN